MKERKKERRQRSMSLFVRKKSSGGADSNFSPTKLQSKLGWDHGEKRERVEDTGMGRRVRLKKKGDHSNMKKLESFEREARFTGVLRHIVIKGGKEQGV